MIGLILAGGRGTRVAGLSRLPKPLLPLAGKPAIAHIVDELRRHRVKEIFIVVPDINGSGREIRQALGNPRDVFLIQQDRPLGPGHAIIVAAEKMNPNYKSPVVVACADTIFRVDELARTSTVYTAPAPHDEDPSRWCYVESDPEWGDKIKFNDKPSRRPKTRQVNIGLYVFGDQSALVDACNREWISYLRMKNLGLEQPKEIQISDIISAYGMEDFRAEPVQEWLDTGTPESFMKARRRRFVSRAFNHLELRRGTLAKRSDNKDKLMKEYEWYKFRADHGGSHFLPPDIRYDKDLGLLTMGYVPYNTASDHYLFDGSLKPKEFTEFLFDVWDEVDPDVEGRASLHPLVVEKTDQRIGEATGPVAMAMRRVWGKYRPLVAEKVANMTTVEPMPGLFHGDLNLTNILVDDSLQDYVVVDPRGEVMGDRRYDLAKIAHSLWGYDHVINGLYEWYDEVEPHFTETQKDIQYEFKEALRERGLLDDVLLITGVLFLSLIPFHYEDESRQRAFLNIGESILEGISHD